MLSKKHFSTPEDHSDIFFLQFSFSTAFEYLSNNFLEFWSKNFGKNCQTAFYVYRRIYRGEIGIWRKNSTFLWLLHFRRKKTHFQGKKISAPLWELTSTGTEGHFERENGSRIKQKNSLDFFGIGASNSPNSLKTSGTFVKFYPFWRKSLKL